MEREMRSETVGWVIDDHPLVARGIAEFLKSNCRLDDVIAIVDPKAVWKALDEGRVPTMAVLDFWLPCGSSVPLLKRLRECSPATAVLVVSADDNAAVRERVRCEGAHGFLHKQESPEIFARAVGALLDGNTWFEHTLGQQPATFVKELSVKAHELGLTARQGEVLALMLKGLPNKRIASALTLSEATVKEHVTGILDRLGAKNRIEIITRLHGNRIE